MTPNFLTILVNILKEVQDFYSTKVSSQIRTCFELTNESDFLFSLVVYEKCDLKEPIFIEINRFNYKFDEINDQISKKVKLFELNKSIQTLEHFKKGELESINYNLTEIKKYKEGLWLKDMIKKCEDGIAYKQKHINELTERIESIQKQINTLS